jgi:hypothetical protein
VRREPDQVALDYALDRGWTLQTIKSEGIGFSGRATAAQVNEMRGEFTMHGIDPESPAAVLVLGYRGDVRAWAEKQGLDPNDFGDNFIQGIMSTPGLVYAHRFDVTDTIHFDLQFNHNMKTNSVLYPHIHLVNKDAIVGAANVTFTLTYSWANIDTAFPGVLSQSNVVVSFADTNALTHKILEFAPITPVAGQGGISSIFIGLLTRVNTGYTSNNIFHLGFDIHYEADTIGSRQEYIK